MRGFVIAIWGKMLGFHRRTRSLIPVKDLAKYDKVPLEDEKEELEYDVEDNETLVDEVSEASDKARKRQLALIYIVFLAEAYVVMRCTGKHSGSRLTLCAASWRPRSSHSSRC